MKLSNLLRALGVVILLYIFSQADFSNLYGIMKECSFSWILLVVALNFPMFLLKSLRWHLILRNQGIHVPYSSTTVIYMAAYYLGFITPGRAGEFARIFYLKEYDIPLTRGFVTVFLDKVFDLYFLLAIGLLGFWRFGLFGILSSLAWVFVVLLMLAPLLFLHGPTASRLITWGSRLLSKKFRHIDPFTSADEYRTGLRAIGARGIVTAATLTVLAFLVFFIQCQMLTWSLGLDAPFIPLVLSMALSSLASLLPVTFAGVGVREFVLVQTFSQFGLGLEPTLAYAMLVFLNFIVLGGLLGLACWLFRPLSSRSGAQAAATPSHR
jgi:uncharacterized protein (TIRG00374 family)